MDNNSLIPKTPDTLAVNLNALCRNSIELIQHARKIAVNQVNLVQLMTYYALGYWIVEEQQSGKGRAGYGKKVIQTLSDALNTEFGKGFSVDTLENARKFYLSYQDRISEALFRNFVGLYSNYSKHLHLSLEYAMMESRDRVLRLNHLSFRLYSLAALGCSRSGFFYA